MQMFVTLFEERATIEAAQRSKAGIRQYVVSINEYWFVVSTPHISSDLIYVFDSGYCVHGPGEQLRLFPAGSWTATG